MPHRTKKKFIDKKKAVTFQLVHRGQRDPLAADEDAPQHVLVPVNEGVTEREFGKETVEERELRLSKQRTFGIGFDDDYDYMQHLKPQDKQTNILIPKNLPVEDLEDFEGMTEILKDGGQSATMMIPSIVFASKQEEEVGMLHRAIPPIGPQVEWDPDVVAAMDEDFDFNDPENFIEDDFILQATEGDGERPDDHAGEEDVSGSDVGSWMSEEDEFYEEETKSRFTQYSMSSSVLPRTEHLALLDDQFEKFYETYDDDKIGDLGQVEIDGAVSVDNIGQQEALKMLLGIKDEVPREVQMKNTLKERDDDDDDSSDSAKSSSNEADEDNGNDDMMELVKEVPREKWDCESILSTYSNIYNHPKVIKDPPKPIKLSMKSGIPLDTLPTRGLTSKQLRILDLQNEESDGRVRAVSECSNVTSISNFRRKDETKEEKAARKQAVKDMRRERRVEKKATTMAFRQEKTRQHKEYLNLQQNLSGIRIS